MSARTDPAPRSRPRPETGGQWAGALTLSLVLHGGLAAWALGAIPTLPQRPQPLPDLRITSVPVEVITPLAPDVIAPEMGGAVTIEPAAPDPLPPASPDRLPPAEATPLPPGPQAETPGAPAPDTPPRYEGEKLLALPGQPLTGDTPRIPPPAGNIWQELSPPETSRPPVAIPDQIATLPGDPTPPVPPRIPSSEAPTISPLVATLIEGIRARLSEPCLLALPEAMPDGSARLTVISANERQTSDFLNDMRALTEGAPFQERRLLLDSRQCPAVTWLRGAPGYPAYGLGVGLASDTITSGERLSGIITNSAGYYTTLLLVDDNGVVQDLRRFLVFSGGRVQFDTPFTREGDARDTGQLLIAIASATRPAMLTEMAGRNASEVFPALGPGLQGGALLGLAPLLVQ